MKLKLASAGAILATLFLATSAQAAPITGNITLSAEASIVTVNFDTNFVSFAPVFPAINAKVDAATGGFALVGLAPVGTLVSYQNFNYGPLSVVNPLWRTASNSVSFSLTNVTGFIEDATLGLLISGTGTINAVGFDPTPGLWSFNASETSNVFSWGSTASASRGRVPDGGASAVLLGVSLLGLAGVSRKFRKI